MCLCAICFQCCFYSLSLILCSLWFELTLKDTSFFACSSFSAEYNIIILDAFFMVPGQGFACLSLLKLFEYGW